MTDPDTAAHARYYEHWQPGWPVVDGWVNWEWDGDDMWCVMPAGLFKNRLRTSDRPLPIDIQALAGVLVGEIAKMFPILGVHLATVGKGWQLRINQEVFGEGHTLADCAVNAWIALHPAKEST